MAMRWPRRVRSMNWRRIGIGALLASFFGVGFYLAGVYGDISELIEQRKAALTSSVLSAPTLLEPGQDIEQMRLLDRLRRLSYTRVSAVAQPGEYLQTPNRIMIYRRRFRWGAARLPRRRD